MEKWYVRNTAGKVFGPIALDMLKAWVKDGRVEPLAGISTDLKSWMLAPLKSELEMNWIVENNPGQFYGPTHRAVVDDLVKSGALTPEARFYQDDRGQGQERLRALEAARAECEQNARQKDVQLTAAQQLAAKKDLQLAALQKTIAQRDERIAESVAALAQKDAALADLRDSLKTKDGELARRAQEFERLAAQLQTALAEVARRDETIASLKEEIARANTLPAREWKVEVVEPEVVDEIPPPVARQAFGFPAGGAASASAPTSLADLERRAQQELARMGAAGVKNFFRRK